VGNSPLKSSMKESKISNQEKEKGVLLILLDLFRSLKLTISLLILLAMLSIVGTVITQNAPDPDYIQRYGMGLYEVLNFFGLFDMYHSWWFSGILLLLVINLVTCSIYRLPGVWNQTFRERTLEELKDSMFKTLPYVERVEISNPSERQGDILSYFKRRFGSPKRIEAESSTTLFAEKGRYSRLGVHLTHFSIIIVLVGGITGSLFGFKGFVNLFEGETTDRIFLRMKNGEVPRSLGFSLRCDDFKITYYDKTGPEKHVKEYVSLLSILQNGKQVLQRTVRVNHPLHYQGLSFYQSSYGTLHNVTLGIQYKDSKEKKTIHIVEGETAPIPNSNTYLQVLKYLPQVHNFGEGVQVLLVKPNQEPRAYWLLKGFPKFDQQRGDQFFLTYEGVTSKEYTGLQVAKDPGVWIVWIGSGLMILGLILSFFFSHQRVWIRIPKESKGQIVLAGSSNKNRVGFEKTFGELVEGMRRLSGSKRDPNVK